MTYYEQGFLTKCAERGLTEKQALSFLEMAKKIPDSPYYSAAAGAGIGGLLGLGGGALIPGRDKNGKTHRLRNALLGALIGAGAGGGAGVGGHYIYQAIKNRRAKPASNSGSGGAPSGKADETSKNVEDQAKSNGFVSQDGSKVLSQDEATALQFMTPEQRAAAGFGYLDR